MEGKVARVAARELGNERVSKSVDRSPNESPEGHGQSLTIGRRNGSSFRTQEIEKEERPDYRPETRSRG